MAKIDLPPRKIYSRPTHCRVCKVELTPENRYTYLGYTKTECKPCKKAISKKYADKRKKAMNEWKRF